MILPTDNPMNRRQASRHVRAVNSTDRFHLLGYSPRPARPDSPSPRAARNGEGDENDRRKPKESAECGPRRPSPKDHPPEEPVSPVASSRLCPDIVSFVLGRVDSPFRVLRLPDILAICKELRRELSKSLENLDTGLAEMIIERASGKRPLDPKVAFLPLASIGHPHADGRLLAMGLAPRKNIPTSQRLHLSAALERIVGKRVALGQFGIWRLEPVTAGSLPPNLLPETWTGQPDGAIDWATVTPIVLDEHATDSVALCDKMIRLACRHDGLPEPCEIIVTPVSAHFGAPPADAFPGLQLQGIKRPHRHAILIFPEPVRGPILLGAGRHDGYGFCRPMPAEA
jgi:CRISPR-associated protein Csb2